MVAGFQLWRLLPCGWFQVAALPSVLLSPLTMLSKRHDTLPEVFCCKRTYNRTLVLQGVLM